MGLQIRTYIDGKQRYLDLYGDENVTIDVSFAEIQDITKRNSAYTQEFKVPGTDNNSDIFNYFFEINSVPLDWNPKRKFEAALIYNGYEIFNGNIRLNMVTINIKEKIYSVTFYASVGDLAANIGDKALCNVDTSSLNHSLYDENVVFNLWVDPSLHPTSLLPTSSSYINPVTNGDVQYILGQRGYDYTGTTFGTIRDINTTQTPVLEFSGTPGFFDNQFTPMIPSYFIPSIRTRKLYELIVNQADYQIESYFFDTDYFGRYYVPLSFNTESPYMAQAKPFKLEILNTSGDTLLGGGAYFNIDEVTGPITNEFVFKSKELITDEFGFNPVNAADYPSDPELSGFSEYVFALPNSPNNPISLQIDFDWDWTAEAEPLGATDIAALVKLYALQNVTPTLVVAKELAIQAILVDTFIGPQTGTTTINHTVDQIIYYPNGAGLYFVSVEWVLGPATVTRVKTRSTNNVIVLPQTIELHKEMGCDQKQIEFIQNVNRMFNLVVVPHPIKPKTLIIEPIVDWIGKGRQLDWTSKVDYNSPQTLRPTTSLINGSIFAANKIDKDFVNTQYNTKSNKIFGQNIIDLGVDYKNATIPLTQSLGQNTDYYLDSVGEYEVALPCYFVTKENNNNGRSVFEYRPFRSLPRMVFKSVPIPSGNTGADPIFYRYARNSTPWTIEGIVSMGDLQNVNRLTTYPFAISGFSHYTTYDASTKFLDNELVYPEVETQYDRYYRDYIEDLTSEENKIYTCKMYLTPWDVSQLYANEVIFIKNAKFRINRISNLSLIEPDMCEVELVKLTRDYTPTPTLFYDLVSCDNDCDIIHSNTDLNYLLWAFEGKSVDIGFLSSFKKYKVIRTDYNQDYTYENVWFTTQRTINGTNPTDYYVNWNYKVYNSCTASTQTHTLSPYNDFSGRTNECVDMYIQNTGTTVSSFTFTNCTGGTQSYILGPSLITRICGLYGSFKGDTFRFCPEMVSPDCSGVLPPYPNTLNWYFDSDLGAYDANITTPELTVVQALDSSILVNATSFTSGITTFYSGYLNIDASFVYQNIAGSINNIAIVAGSSYGDDSYGRLNIPSPSVGTLYNLSFGHYFPASGNLYVTIITY
jgi:hypothetical protein